MTEPRKYVLGFESEEYRVYGTGGGLLPLNKRDALEELKKTPRSFIMYKLVPVRKAKSHGK